MNQIREKEKFKLKEIKCKKCQKCKKELREQDGICTIVYYKPYKFLWYEIVVEYRCLDCYGRKKQKFLFD